MKKNSDLYFPHFSPKNVAPLFLHIGLFLLALAIEFSLAFFLYGRIWPNSPFLHLFSESSLLNELLQGASRAAVVSMGFGFFFSYTAKKQEKDSHSG